MRGKFKGRTAVLHQFANDWMTVDIVGGPQGQVVGPLQVKLTEPEEFDRFSPERAGNSGRFGDLWRLGEDGRFSRARR